MKIRLVYGFSIYVANSKKQTYFRREVEGLTFSHFSVLYCKYEKSAGGGQIG